MNDKHGTAGTGWSEAFADMQRKYLDAWTDLLGQVPGMKGGKPPESPFHPWRQSVDFWAKMLTPAMPEESRSWMEKMLELNRGYLQMGETLFGVLSAGQESGKDFGQTWENFSQSVQKMQEQMAADFGAAKDPWSGFATMWGLPLDTWKRVASAWSMMPGDSEKAFRDVGSPDAAAFPSMVSRWLSTPTLGYTRESQEEMQRLGQLWTEHMQAVQAYAEVLSRVTTRAAELLGEKVLKGFGKGETFDSLRGCYDAWVDCGEEAYAEVSGSEEFTRAQAKLTNTLMAAKRQEQKMVDEVLGALNMPTRRELDTSHRRLHQLQRQVWRMQQEIDAAGVAELREQVAALERQLGDLTRAAGPASTPSAEVPARRSARPKKLT